MSVEIRVSLPLGVIQAIQAAANKQQAVSTPHIVSGSVNAIVDAVLEMLPTLENQTRRDLAQRAPTPYPIKNEQTSDDDHPATPKDADHPVVKQEQDLGFEQPAAVPRENQHNAPGFQHSALAENQHIVRGHQLPLPAEHAHTPRVFQHPPPAEFPHNGPDFQHARLAANRNLVHFPQLLQLLDHYQIVYVHVPSGRHFAMPIYYNSTIGDIRESINEREGVPGHQQHLDCDGICVPPCADGTTLESLGIRDGALVTLYDH